MCLPDGKRARAFGDCGFGTWQMAINRTRSASGKLTLHRILEGFFHWFHFEVTLFTEMQEIEVIISKRLWEWSPSSLPRALIFQSFFPTSICRGIGLHPFVCIASDV